jgi:hypothetical protein
LEKDDGHSERKHIDHPAVQENSDDYTASCSPSSRQYHASEQAFSERYRPTTPLKCATDGRTLQSLNYGRRIQPSTEAQQDEAEETTQDILGPRIINLPTVQFTLKLQATRIDPIEWVSAKQIIEIEPKAGKNSFLLTKLFDQDAKATKKEEKEKAATILQADGLH